METEIDDSSLPKQPREPSQDDCCGSGCSHCVFDAYQKELAKWEKECERILKGGRPSKFKEILSQSQFKTFSLIGITRTAEYLNIYRFSVPEGLTLDVKPGQHLMMKGFVNNNCDMEEEEKSSVGDKSVIMTTERIGTPWENVPEETFPRKKYLSRAYTILNNQAGYFEMLIKLYSNGEMSEYIRALNVGDCVLWRGPFGEYHHSPSYSQCSTGEAETIVAICAGTGIAPVYAISRSIVCDERDETRIRILWANHSWNHLPLVQEMKELTSYWNFSCRLFFSEVDLVPPGSITFFEVTNCKINLEVLAEEFESLPAANIKVLLCGSISFEEDVLVFLNKLGLHNSNCHRFQ